MSEKILLRKKSPTHKVEAKPAKARPVFDSESDLDSDLESDSETHAETGNSEPQTLSLGEIGEIALLEVVDKSSIGTFLDWGKPKDLFLPFAEQTRDLSIGDEILVHIYLDNTQRPAASMRLEKFLKKTPLGLEEFSKSQKEVDLLIYMKTDLGYKAVVNGCYQGVIYASDVFKPLHYGQKTKGYIHKIRTDGKIDLVLQKPGFKATLEIEPQLLVALKENNGFLPITDKTSPDVIYNQFGVSKKKFKIALGGLYKKRLLRVEDDGIYLVAEASAAKSPIPANIAKTKAKK